MEIYSYYVLALDCPVQCHGLMGHDEALMIIQVQIPNKSKPDELQELQATEW